jgi:hypothetical protein
MKVFLFNQKTKDVKLSSADQNLKVYQQYLADGYVPIAFVEGFNTKATPYNNKENREYFGIKSCDFKK